jgi:oxepin-CoA hydrolase/3-oxo-5,6-dehydrosuberyl-CoA semialdehyde dehydrogenase
MAFTIDISDRQQVHNLLLQLQPETPPRWGSFTARHMVEHLVEQVEYTNGKKFGTCDRPPEEAAEAKQIGVYTDSPIPKNIVLDPPPVGFRYPDISTAVAQLMQELADFDVYFQDPGATSVHGGFGPMTGAEWRIWHSKHFTHHFRQFGLLQEP